MLIAAVAALGMVSAADAATLSGKTEGSWRSNDIGWHTNSCRFSTSSGSNTGVAWGSPRWSCPDDNNIGQDDSYIVLQDYGFSYDITSTGMYQIGQIKWRNESTYSKTTPNLSPVADFKLDLDTPVNGTVFEALAFNIDNTTNVNGGTSDSILAMTWSNYGLSLPIDLGDGLTLTGFKFGLIGNTDGETFSQSHLPNGDFKFTWTNKEGNTSKLALYANISVAAVPVPAAAWLLLSGLGGIALLRRRTAV